MVGCGEKEKQKSGEKAEMKTYKVAMEPTFPPIDTTDKETGDLTGFDVDLMEAIAKDQGFKLKWENMSFAGLIPALEAGNVDILASGMWASDERKKKVDFSDTYYESGLVLAVASTNNKVKSIDDLSTDMKVGGQIGTSGGDMAKKLKKENKIKDAKIYEGLDVAVMDLKNGVIDVLINDKPVSQEYVVKQKGKIKIVGDNLSEEDFGFAVQKGNKKLLNKKFVDRKSVV